MNARARSGGSGSLLRHTQFRRIWIASLFCNAVQYVQGVCAAWAMVKLSASPAQIALVQTALMVPLMLLALPGGALADVFDRRKAMMAALAVAFSGALALTLLAALNAITIPLVLLSCFVVGTGMAFFTPAWQGSVMELVDPKEMPAGVALNAMSLNVARSVGPVLAGAALIVLGTALTSGLNMLMFVPMLVVILLWRRPPVANKLPREELWHASLSGLRYAALTPMIRGAMVRALVTGLGASAIYALLPLVAKDVLHGNAGTYGLLLGGLGGGAVAASFAVVRLRRALQPEAAVRLYFMVMGVVVMVLALSTSLSLTLVALFVAGACWGLINTTINISIQMASPGWVSGRLLAIFYAAVACGLALGSWMWGHVATLAGLHVAIFSAGVLLAVATLLGWLIPLPPHAESPTQTVPAPTIPEVKLAINGKSGPIVVEVNYRIQEAQRLEFLQLMPEMLSIRNRNGAYGVTLSRDLADPLLWKETTHYPTWNDYVRARDRLTRAERQLQKHINALHDGPEPTRVRRIVQQPDEVIRPRGKGGGGSVFGLMFRSATDHG